MATAAQAIQRVSEVTGMQLATVARAARALREADITLWPQGEKGRGRGAQVVPNHLVNLIVALAVANPLTEAATQIPSFLQMVPIDLSPKKGGRTTEAVAAWREGKGLSATIGRFLPGETVQEALVNLVSLLGQPEGATLREACEGMHVTFQRDDKSTLVVFVSYYEWHSHHTDADRTGDGWTNSGLYYAPNDQLPTAEQAITRLRNHPGFITRTSVINFAAFVALGDIWADTIAHNTRAASKTTPVKPARATPENDMAATAPCQGNSAAMASSDQPEDELDGGFQPHHTRERDETQSRGLRAVRSVTSTVNRHPGTNDQNEHRHCA